MNLLTDDELLAVAAAAEASGPKDDHTMDRIITWANRASADAALLELVIEGSVILDWNHINDQIRVKLTEAAHRGTPDA